MLTTTEIYSIIQQGENETLEFKNIWKDEYLKTLCAFANTSGGDMLIGVDDYKNIIGIAESNKLLELLPNKIADNDTDNRLNKIIELINKNNKISTKQLSLKCKVSQITIKRDIEKLKKQNKLKRIGGERTGYWEVVR